MTNGKVDKIVPSPLSTYCRSRQRFTSLFLYFRGLALGHDQLVVYAALAQQLHVVAGFYDAPLIEHDEFVRLPERRQPVRDRERRAPFHDPAQALLYRGLGLDVERAGRLVENQYRRVLYDCPRDGEALPLAARYRMPVLAYDRVVAVRRLHDKIMRVGDLARRDDFVGGRVGLRVSNVVVNRPREQECVLEHDADIFVQIIRRHIAQIGAVDPNAPDVRIVEAHQQVDQSAFADPGSPDDAYHFARLDFQADVF